MTTPDPCPFCRSPAQVKPSAWGAAGRMREPHYVICTGCGAATRLFEDRQSAIECWNLRVPAERLERA